ncbi:MAG TPA: M1 family aminopeptidase [Polyangiaceae bacterium]
MTEHLALDLALDLAHKSVSGSATLSVRRESPLDHVLVLDALGFAITKLSLVVSGKESEPAYEYDGEQLRVPIPKNVKRANVVIQYSAKPRRGLYFLSPDKQVASRPVQVWSQCQDEDARHWFPCQDKPHVKMTTEMRVEVPHGFVALSNGRLVASETPKVARAVWRYHFRLDQPHPSYLVTLVVGQFSVLEDKAVTLGGHAAPVPVTYYVPKGREADGWRAFADTPKMIRLFSELTGVAYPWDSYAQVVVSDFIFGGMENTTATTMYEHILLDERAALDITSNDLVAHELAHQWFGDYVTCRDWSHAWLNEGFATFFEHVEREHRLGRDEYEYGVAGDVDTYLSEAGSRYERAIVCRDYQEPIDLFDRHLYEKGGLVLHQLRRQLGDEVFWSGVNGYLTANAGGIVETNDLMRALEKASGRSLEQFFDQWVFRPGHPVLKIKVSYDDRVLVVQLKQTQKTGETAVFSLPISIRVVHADKHVTLHERHIDSASDALVVPCETRPLWVEVDPDFRLIGSLSIASPSDFLRAQLRGGSSARMRWMAARSLGEKDDMLGIEALGQALADEQQSWMVRAEAAKALGRIRGADAFGLLVPQVKGRHPKVRRAVTAALGNFKTPEAFRLLTQRCKTDPSYLVRSTAADALGATRQPAAASRLVAMLGQESWADVVRAGALSGLARTRDESALDAVFEMSAYGVPTRARRAAIAALPQLSEGRKVREHLERLLDDAGPHVRISAIDALEELADEKGKSALRRHLRRELDGRVSRRAREALRNLGEGTSAQHKKLVDDLETLRGEVAELRIKLAKLEGKRPGGSEKPGATAAVEPRTAKKAPYTKAKARASRSRVRKAARGK